MGPGLRRSGGWGGEVGRSGDEGEGKSQEPPAGNEGANEQVPEGKSEGGSTGDVGVQTRSRASSSNLKQSRHIKSGGKRKRDTDDVEEEAKQASEEQSQKSQAANKEENAQLPEGKSEGDSTVDAGTEVQTGS